MAKTSAQKDLEKHWAKKAKEQQKPQKNKQQPVSRSQSQPAENTKTASEK